MEWMKTAYEYCSHYWADDNGYCEECGKYI